jgi:hypothetical protein
LITKIKNKIATIIQRGHIEKKTSDEIAEEIIVSILTMSFMEDSR